MSLFDRVVMTEAKGSDQYLWGYSSVYLKNGTRLTAKEQIDPDKPGPWKLADLGSGKVTMTKTKDIDVAKSLKNQADSRSRAANDKAARKRREAAKRPRSTHRKWHGGATGDVD